MRTPGHQRAAAGSLTDVRTRVRAGEAVMLAPRAGRLAPRVLAFAALTAAGAWGLAAKPSVLITAGVLFFGGFLAHGALELIPGRAYLRVAPDGLTVRSPLRTRRIDWADVEYFTVRRTRHQHGVMKHVGFTCRDGTTHGLPAIYGDLTHEGLAAVLGDAHRLYRTGR
jgi:PH (Pleckstrin Homology) domain-containing protein